jgi:imidazolonepropionase-like amidohydrolase
MCSHIPLLVLGIATAANAQVILVEKEKFTEVGASVAIPAGADVIDLSAMTVLPGLVDVLNHLALTFPTWNARSMLAGVTPARTAASPAR